jgi:serine/threonine protein kinase
MNEHPDSVQAIFRKAVDNHDPDQWPSFLDRVCADAPDLRRGVEVLLEAHREAATDLHPLAAPGLTSGTAASFDEVVTEWAGLVIGPYKLLELIGEGGFGAVFLAEQQQPVRRRVALKVLKPGMDCKPVIVRFEAERQALALMDHPNIAKVLDGGQTARGQPYFVMDLVKGLPITEYCDQQRLTTRERLELFVHVCQAVQHAHQKGIIHRDLKPSNVLVTSQDGAALVKVIDFGIAKAMGQQLTDKTLFTGFAQLIGTPLYMSPEQAALSNVDVDTRSDIYSLGVLLYELLTGTTPFDRERLRQGGYDEMRRIICQEEPHKPSTQISTLGQAAPTISTNRKSDPKHLSRLLHGELDWIVMRALEKDRNRRYDTASAFAADVQRYLADEPVLAGPPSAWYRIHKFVRRNKSKVMAAGAMLALVLVGLGASLWQAVRATRAEQQTSKALAEATAAQAQTREALDALTEDVVETLFAKQPILEAKETAFLDKVLGFYESFTQESAPSADARFLRAKGSFTVAHLRGLLGRHRDAVEGFRRAEALLEDLAAEFPETADYREKLARAEGNLGVELAMLGDQAGAETALRRGIALRSQLVEDFPDNLEYRVDLANNYNDLAFLRELQRNYAEAEEGFRHALALKQKLVADAGDQPRYRLELIRGLSNLGQVLRLQEKYAESETTYRQALNGQEEQIRQRPASPKDRHGHAQIYSGLGATLTELKRMPDAEDAFRRSVEICRKLADDFPAVLKYRQSLASFTENLAYFLTRQGKDSAAEEPYRQALEMRKAILAQGGPLLDYRQELARAYHNLANVQSVTQRPREAETTWRAALEIWNQLAVDFPRIADVQNGLSLALVRVAGLQNQRGEFKAAAALLERAQTHIRAAQAARPQDAAFRETYRDYLMAFAESRHGLADHAHLATTAAELAQFSYEPVEDAYRAAGWTARCMPLAHKDAALSEGRRTELAQGYAQQALALLRQAVTHGFVDVSRMQKDPDLEALRSTKEYRKVLGDLEGGRKAK